ncbi:MAG: DNA translocase FtsK 4TM domain-containing protein, partial [Rhodothermales bacterium]|nr:DNA translocase FtsK 4TM domain-containing protein [Rhodothermales bacterium]
MAKTTTKRRRKASAKKKTGAPLLSAERKREILGLLLMAVAALVGLALVTYDPADAEVARQFSLEAALHPGRTHAGNALGLVGAALAQALVAGFLGYTALLLCGLLMAWGYVTFRHKPTAYLPRRSVLILAGAFLIAAMIGWFGIALEQDLGAWSGAVGAGLAAWMRQVLGAVGSFVILLLLLLLTALVVFDRDVQPPVERLEAGFLALRTRLAEGWGRFRAHQAERRQARAERRRVLAEQRERDRTERDRRLDQERREAARAERRTAAKPAPRPAAEAPPPRPRAPVPPPPDALDEPPLNDHLRGDHEAAPPPAARPPAPPPRPAPAPADEPRDIALTVRERVEEEKADVLDHTEEAVDPTVPYAFPPVDLLDEPEDGEAGIDYDELEDNKQLLLEKLATYNIEIVDINAVVGPTVTLYELTPAPGVKISRITALEDDLAMALAARGIRMIAPIPGKSAIGVEIPNRHRELVRIRDVIGTAKFRDAQMELPMVLGKNIEGEVYLQDLTKMPHLLIA